MNLLDAKLYDPAVAVSKATTAALAMTAVDTVNLRLAITVPAHGKVLFRLSACLHGATTFPSILLGVMNGATVIGRVAPIQSLGNTAVATALVNVYAEFTATGLAPGAMNVDAAYGVETLVAATGLKYGGPNNTTANDAFGGFVFEAWDPQPQTANSTLAVDANGRVDLGKVLGTAQSAGDLKASLNTLQTDTDDIQTRLPAALVGGRMDSSTGAMAANVITAAAINAAALNGKGDWNIGKTGYALSAAGILAIWDALTLTLTTVGSIGKMLVDRIDVILSSRLATVGYTAPLDAVGMRAAVGLAAANLDLQIVALPTALQNRVEMDLNSVGLSSIFARTDVATSSRLSAAGYTAPDNAGVAAIKGKTDNLIFTVANKLDVNLLYVNGIQVVGNGALIPWGPA